MLEMIRRLFQNPHRAKEHEARAIKMEIEQKAAATKDSLDHLNDVIRQSAAYRIAVAAGRKYD